MTGYLQAVMLTKVAYMYVLACSNSDVIKFEKWLVIHMQWNYIYRHKQSPV